MPAIQSAVNVADPNKIRVLTNPCCVCGKTHQFELDKSAYYDWMNGVSIQRAFPEMSAADREILISGTCDECFNKLFPPEEDDG